MPWVRETGQLHEKKVPQLMTSLACHPKARQYSWIYGRSSDLPDPWEPSHSCWQEQWLIGFQGYMPAGASGSQLRG